MIRWWRVGNFQAHGSDRRAGQSGHWSGRGEFRWQLLRLPEDPEIEGRQRVESFELSCDVLPALKGWTRLFPSSGEARAEAERIERRAANRRRALGDAGTLEVVLWPDDWEILESSVGLSPEWTCPSCGMNLPAYKVEIAGSESKKWICSGCSMPLEWRDSPERLRLSGIELDRLEAIDLEAEWGVAVTALVEGQFFVEDSVYASAVHLLCEAWLPSYLTTRSVLCYEEDPDGNIRWLTFINDQERLVILVEADSDKATHIGYFVNFGSLNASLKLKESWRTDRGWVDQLPDAQIFWLEDGHLRNDPKIETEQIKAVLWPEGPEPA